MVMLGLESHFLFIPLSDPYFVITISEIQLGKLFNLIKLI